MIRDYLQIGLAMLGGFIMSFCLYLDIYRNNPPWARLAVIGLIFFFFYVHCFKTKYETKNNYFNPFKYTQNITTPLTIPISY